VLNEALVDVVEAVGVVKIVGVVEVVDADGVVKHSRSHNEQLCLMHFPET
jgi:hypothetical protein